MGNSSSERKRQIKTKWMDIKPSTATKWLEKNSVNRKLSDSHVKRLAEDMELGRYQMTHQGVAFDWNGNLLDGQHRLAAIVKSGAQIRMLVTSGLPPKSMAVMDVDVKKRSLANVLQIDGGIEKFGISPRILQTVARAMYNGPHRRRPPSSAAMRAFAIKYVDPIAWACHQFATPGKGIGRSAAVAAVARAYVFGKNRGIVTQVSRFAMVLNSGITDGTDAERALIPLRDRLLKMDGRGNGAHGITEFYQKVASTLDAFVRGKRSGRWDAFPISEDRDAAAELESESVELQVAL